MLASTDRHGNNAESWKAIPNSWLRCRSVGDWPFINAVPAVGSSRPARIRSTVDLPQPDGPSSDRNEPSGVAIDTSSSAVTVELPRRARVEKVFVSPEILMPVPGGRDAAALMQRDVRSRV